MAPVQRLDAARASVASLSHHDSATCESDSYNLIDFEDELKRLSTANQELLEEIHHQNAEDPGPADPVEVELLRLENAQLRSRIQELEALETGAIEELWLERQREYELLLEEKSEVIRGLHQKIQDSQESVSIADGPPPSSGATGTRLGQAEEIMRLKRELEDQRRQLEQDEEDMMGQMRQMEMTMAKERAEMARQKQEVQRLQADLAREIEQSGRDPELRERLHSLRRRTDPKPAAATIATEKPAAVAPSEQQSSSFFRRIFG